MAWIAVHEQIDGTKLRQLKKAVGCSKAEAIGILVMLWIWGLDNADRCGFIKAADREDLAEVFASGLSRKLSPESVVEALIKTGWIDEEDDRLSLHDWDVWQEQWYKALDKREKDRDRKRKEKNESNGNSNGNSMESLSQPSPSPSPSPVPSYHRNQNTASFDSTQYQESTGDVVGAAEIPSSDWAGNNVTGAAAPAPVMPAKKAYGQYGWVKLSDAEYGRLAKEFGDAELKRCIQYIDESAQTTGNKNRWKDWNLVVRKCHREQWGVHRGGSQAAGQRPSASAGAVNDLQALHQMFSGDEP